MLDFETSAEGTTPSVPFRSASAACAVLGMSFSGGDEFPGQPVFRGWSSFSSLIAKRPPPGNRFVLSTFQQHPGSYLDIVVSFATPVSSAEGDVVFNPTVTATAIAYNAHDEFIDQAYFWSGSPTWSAGRFSFASQEGIAKILLRTSLPEAQIGLDNLVFMPVPEPSGRAALVAGMAGMVLLALRKCLRRRASMDLRERDLTGAIAS